MLETLQQYLMINSVKSSTEIKETEQCHVTSIGGPKDVRCQPE